MGYKHLNEVKRFVLWYRGHIHILCIILLVLVKRNRFLGKFSSCICRITIYLYKLLVSGRDSLIDFESCWFNLCLYNPMVRSSYVIRKLTLEEDFIFITLTLFKIQIYIAEIIGSPSMSPFVGTPTTPLDF